MKWAALIQEGNRIDELVVAAEHALGSFSSKVAEHKSKLNEQVTLLNNAITISNTLRKHFNKDADEVVESQKRLVDDEDKLADLHEALGELEAEIQPLRNEYENLSAKLSESMTLAESTRFEGEPAHSPPPSQLQLGTQFTEMQQRIQHESSSTRKSPSPRKRDLHGSSTDTSPEKPSHAKRHQPESLSPVDERHISPVLARADEASSIARSSRLPQYSSNTPQRHRVTHPRLGLEELRAQLPGGLAADTSSALQKEGPVQQGGRAVDTSMWDLVLATVQSTNCNQYHVDSLHVSTTLDLISLSLHQSRALLVV